MAKYLFKASYTPEGIKGVMKEGGSSRVNAVEKTVAGLGGTLESFYFAFGATDVFVTVDLPDHATAVAFAAAVGSTGSLSTTETVVLLTPGEIDAAIHKSVDYRAPARSSAGAETTEEPAEHAALGCQRRRGGRWLRRSVRDRLVVVGVGDGVDDLRLVEVG